jgi:hypothetical protein
LLTREIGRKVYRVVVNISVGGRTYIMRNLLGAKGGKGSKSAPHLSTPALDVLLQVDSKPFLWKCVRMLIGEEDDEEEDDDEEEEDDDDDDDAEADNDDEAA